MGAWIDYISDKLGIPNSHGGPINGTIVDSFDLETRIGALNDEGEWAEYFFGGGASIIIGLSGELLIKMERVSGGYDLIWQMTGSITGDLTAGIKAGAKGYVELLGCVQIGAPVTFHFATLHDAVQGMAIAIRLALSLGATPLIRTLGPAGWLIDGILIDRTMDDIYWLGRRVVGIEVKLSAKLEIGAKVGVEVAAGLVDEWGILSAGVKASAQNSTSFKARYENNRLSISFVAQSEIAGAGSAKAVGWGPEFEVKFVAGTELLAKDISRNLLQYPNALIQWGKAEAKLNTDHFGNPEINADFFLGATASGGVNIAPGLAANEFGVELRGRVKLLNILRCVFSLVDSSNSFNQSLLILGDGLVVSTKLTNQEIYSCLIDESIKICGMGISLKIGRRQGYNSNGFPQETSQTANDMVDYITSQF